MPTHHHQNFRLRGISGQLQSRLEVRELVKNVLSIESGVSCVVHSLAVNPIEHRSKIATLSFHTLPGPLSDKSKSEWIFEQPPSTVDELPDQDIFGPDGPLVFDTHFSGFTPLHRSQEENCCTDIIIISGLGGHALGSFKGRDGSFVWIRDALPLDFPSARIFTYGYDTTIIRSSSSVEDLSQSRLIVFIGHSLGGLVIKEAMVMLRAESDDMDVAILASVSGFLFFGVPHMGMATKSLVPLFKDQPNRSLLESLNTNSALLYRLEKEFGNAFGQPSPQRVAFYETQKSPTAEETEDGKWKNSGPLEVLVEVTSAICGSARYHPIDRNHREMVKYSNHYDQLYTRVKVVLKPLFMRKHDISGEHLSGRNEHQPVVIFVDALDESGEKSAKKLLKYFKDVMKSVERAGTKVKICFSSRHYPILDICTIPSTSVELHNGRDIRSVITSQLKEIRPEDWRQQIETEILLKTRGGFQWAILVAGMVMDCYTTGTRRERLVDMVTTIPETLNELYKNLLSDVGEDERKHVAKLFQWLLFARRPLCAQELREALATDMNMTTCTTVNELRTHDCWIESVARFETYIKHISRGLVEFKTRDEGEQINEPGGESWEREAQFIHQSVADYVLETFLGQIGQGRRQSTKSERGGAGHGEILTSCLYYMRLKEVLEGPISLSRDELLARYPLLLYAASSLFHHVQEVEQEGSAQPDLLSLIQWRKDSKTLGTFAGLWKVLDPHGLHAPLGWPFVEATPLHALVPFGSKKAVIDLLKQGNVDVNGRDDDGNTPLLLAIGERLEDMALLLLSDRSRERQLRRKTSGLLDLNARNKYLDTPLSLAMNHKLERMMMRLMEAGADPKLTGKETDLIFFAIRCENEALLLRMIQSKIDFNGILSDLLTRFYCEPSVDLTVGFFSSAFLKAKALLASKGKSRRGNEPPSNDVKDIAGAVRLLLSHGISASCRDKSGRVPLLVATENGDVETVRLLLRSAPRTIEVKDVRGRTALSAAMTEWDEEMALLLIREGAFPDPSVVLFHYCLDAFDLNKWSLVRAILSKDETWRSNIINKAWERDFRSDDVQFVLCLVYDGHFPTIIKDTSISSPSSPDQKLPPHVFARLLIEEDLDADWTPLSHAAKNGYAILARLLIQNGVDTEQTDRLQRTPLMHAVENGRGNVVWSLLDKGVRNLHAKDSRGRTAFSIAVEKEDGYILEKLLEEESFDARMETLSCQRLLLRLAHRGSQALVDLLLKKGVDRWVTDESKQTPLLLAAKAGQFPIVSILLDRAASAGLSAAKGGIDDESERRAAHIDAIDGQGRTALSWASCNGHRTVVQKLISKGAGLNVRDCDGSTPLFLALYNGHEAIARILVEKGAEVNIRDSNGWTPLFLASFSGQVDVVRFLVANGADFTVRNRFGLTALKGASINGHGEIAGFLEEKGAIM
ncbi:hypothetical protein CP532_0314 [Ophiocordyceps camponoti-leonardi (nom. inval.)]|nr:hypothetical protein CP532_0314 [Ophiocordyceps camponoti-leonardi (nom. inval.)]